MTTPLTPDQLFIKNFKATNPELAVLNNPQFIAQDLEKIGITFHEPNLPLGYIKYLTQDFIVEEIDLENNLSTIDFKEYINPGIRPKKTFLHCTLVKQGVPSNYVINELKKITKDDITNAGIKDGRAVTAQQISFRKSNAEELANLKSENFFLKNLEYKKGLLVPGSLVGNRFTILVRTPQKLFEDFLVHKAKHLEENGFPNFYSLQRFGMRLTGYKLGKAILQNNYLLALRLLFGETSVYEMPYVKTQRTNAMEHFGNWLKMKEYFTDLPYYFHNELRFLDSLIKNNNPLLAFKQIQDQTTLWVYAYRSFLFNNLLSTLLTNNQEIPEFLPLISSDSLVRGVYKDILQKEDIEQLVWNLPQLSFVRLAPRNIKAKIFPKNITIKSVDQGVILSFDLEKGAYATAFLTNFFTLYQGEPTPTWLSNQEIDLKKELGTGSYESSKHYLAN